MSVPRTTSLAVAATSTTTATATTTTGATDFGDAPVSARLRRRHSYRRGECGHVMPAVRGRSRDNNHRWPQRPCRRRHVSRRNHVDDNSINRYTPVWVVRSSVEIAHATETLAETDQTPARVQND
ncbi:unnamed protein product [Macrosiphum euphorbiae]|uniref:Secreted protein n=1 Tax=Macrosiphum euphorbiae TaxID=13131 RepID=A0AAV0VJV9_9HEMI|nr:unnamed protein product [Macrosiphum euphorbiae]